MVKLIAQIVVYAFVFLGSLLLMRTQINGAKAMMPSGFPGVVFVLVFTAVEIVVLHFAGASSEIIGH